jgi:16S rRNA (guanine527-N7)-methyltransferase
MAESLRQLLERRAEAAGLTLAPALRDQLEGYFTLLGRWNARINLTGLPLDPPTPAAIDRLVIEPLLAVPLIDPNISIWFDLGSGGGSPALPLQLARPVPRLVLVESKERKAAFLREAIRELHIAGSEVEVSRIEQVTAREHNAGLADLVTIRAVRIDASLFGQIQMLLRFRGQAILFGAHVGTEDLPRGLELSETLPSRGGLTILRRRGL